MSELATQAERIRSKADAAAAKGDTAEFHRLMLLAECLFPSDPVAQRADVIETQEVASRHPQTIGDNLWLHYRPRH